MWAGSALVFIPVMGEYLVPHFIGQGKVSVLGTIIWKEFETSNWPYAAACSAWLVGLVALLVAGSAGRQALKGRPAANPAAPSRESQSA
jgi:ABC-type spermidine/putrescine transport system permease subunit I